MKKWIGVLTAVFVVAMVNSGQADMDKRYTIKSGIVEYKISGVQEGTETLYFDEYGTKEGRHTSAVTSFMGIEQNIEESQYFDGESMFSYNKEANTAMKINVGEMAEGFKEASGTKNLRDFGQQTLEELGAEKTGTKEIAGKTCDVWNIAAVMTTACIYKDSLPLEMESNVGDMQVRFEAVSIQEDVAIPQEMVELPKTAQISDAIDIRQIVNEQGGAELAEKALPNVLEALKQAGEAQQEAATQETAQETQE